MFPRPAAVARAAACATNFLLEVSEEKRSQNFGEDTRDGWTYSRTHGMQVAEALGKVGAVMHLLGPPLQDPGMCPPAVGSAGCWPHNGARCRAAKASGLTQVYVPFPETTLTQELFHSGLYRPGTLTLIRDNLQSSLEGQPRSLLQLPGSSTSPPAPSCLPPSLTGAAPEHPWVV